VLEKLVIAQLAKKFSSIYGTQIFMAMFTRAHHWILS
jgi:hypothetical protein